MTGHGETFYGLSNPPFGENGGPVLLTEALRSAANFVRRGLAEGISTLCLTGSPGIGKSSLVRALSRLIGGECRIAAMSGRAQAWGDLRRVMVREFGVGATRITCEELERAHAKHGKLVFVVDDAQHLAPDLLERICVLPRLRTAAGEPVAQVILLADLYAVSREAAGRLLSWVDPAARHGMESLSREEVCRYIDTRMRHVGWCGRSLVSESAAEALHRASHGNPRRLNLLFADMLERAASRGAARIDAAFVGECTRSDRWDAAESLPPLAAFLSETPEQMMEELADEICDETHLELDVGELQYGRKVLRGVS